MNKSFDVFLSHNSKDKPAVRELAEALRARGLDVWLDEWELVPGRPWQEALEEVIETTGAAAVLVGKDGLGPWQNKEMRGLLAEFVDRELPVIPVLLPDAPEKPALPIFLKGLTWVNLRGGLTEEGIDQIQWGVTGKRPDLIPTTTFEIRVETNTAYPPSSTDRDDQEEKAAIPGQERQENIVHSIGTSQGQDSFRPRMPERFQSMPEPANDYQDTDFPSSIGEFLILAWMLVPMLCGLPLLVIGGIVNAFCGGWRSYSGLNRVVAGFYYLSTVELGRLLWKPLLACWEAPAELTSFPNINKVIGAVLFLVCLLLYFFPPAIIVVAFSRWAPRSRWVSWLVHRVWGAPVNVVYAVIILDILYIVPLVVLILCSIIFALGAWLLAK
jgi:hypothetical protein